MIVVSYEFHSCVGTGFGPWRQNFDAKRILKNSDATMHKARSIKPRIGRLQQTSRDHPAPGKFIFSCQPDPKHQHQGNSSNLRFRFHLRRPSRSRGRHRPPPRPPRDPRETLKRPSRSGMWRFGRPRRRGWPSVARSAVYLVRRFQPSCWYSTARLEIPGPSTLQMRWGGVPQSIHARSNPCASAYMCSHGSARVRPAPRLRSLVLKWTARAERLSGASVEGVCQLGKVGITRFVHSAR